MVPSYFSVYENKPQRLKIAFTWSGWSFMFYLMAVPSGYKSVG